MIINFFCKNIIVNIFAIFQIPFDNEVLEVIFAFDPDKDADKIRNKLLIREDCIRTMRVCTRLLQIGARMHLNLHEIAKISTRKNIDEESILEHLVRDSIIQVCPLSSLFNLSIVWNVHKYTYFFFYFLPPVGIPNDGLHLLNEHKQIRAYS